MYIYISINVYMYVYVVCVCVYFFLMNCCIYAGALPLNNTHFLRTKYSLIKPQYIYYFQIFNIHIILLIYFPYSNFVNYFKIFFFFFSSPGEDPVSDHPLCLVVMSLVSFSLEQFLGRSLSFVMLTFWENIVL